MADSDAEKKIFILNGELSLGSDKYLESHRLWADGLDAPTKSPPELRCACLTPSRVPGSILGSSFSNIDSILIFLSQKRLRGNVSRIKHCTHSNLMA